MTLEFTVEQKENGMLLRDFLRKRGVSAALAKGVKASDGFFRDGAPVHTDMRLSAGQRISFALPPEPPTEVLPQALPLDILYEDAHAMVLNKPAGQTVHPTRGYADGTLANAFRGQMCIRDSAGAEVFDLGDCHVEFGTHRVFVAGHEVALTPQEFMLLGVLVRNRNLALSREKLLQLAWGYDYEGDTRTVDVHIQKLRKKLGFEDRIQTVYKLGYRLSTKE